jgi:adenylate cyclase
VTRYTRENAAERAGIEPFHPDRLVELGIVTPADTGRFSPGDVRRALMATSLEEAAIPLDLVVSALRSGALSLDVLDGAAYERFAALAGETFQLVSDRTGLPAPGAADRHPRGDRLDPALTR